MSYGRHNASSEVAHLVADVRRMTAEQALEAHGIEINADKTVYDSTYEKSFKNINEWAAYVVKEETNEWDEDSDHYSNKWDDDDGGR